MNITFGYGQYHDELDNDAYIGLVDKLNPEELIASSIIELPNSGP